MSKNKSNDCCYEEMTNAVGGQSMPQDYHDEPMRSDYENSRKNWNANGYNQSGTEVDRG